MVSAARKGIPKEKGREKKDTTIKKKGKKTTLPRRGEGMEQ